MSRKNMPVNPWPLVVMYLGMMAALVACATTGTVAPTETSVATETVLLRVEDGAVKVKGQDEAWMPVAGESTFELVGELQGTDPWMVTGNTFAIRDSTQIAEGLEAGDLVRVRGIILEDNTWLANSIKLAREQTDPTIMLIGTVTSTAPWVVHGITLNVTADTVITGDIAADTIALVEILLLDDGMWEVLSIAPVSDFTEIPGCATVTATVVSIKGNEIQFAGWPVVIQGEDVTIENEGGTETTLSANQPVLVVVCATEDGQFRITKIIVLKADNEDASGSEETVLICHLSDKNGGRTLSVATAAVPAHLAHGDKEGPCP